MPDGYETLSGAVGRASDLGLEPPSQLTPPLHFNFLISDFYVTNLIDRSRLGTPKFWCATEAASSFSVIHRRVPRNFHSASRRGVRGAGLHKGLEVNCIVSCDLRYDSALEKWLGLRAFSNPPFSSHNNSWIQETGDSSLLS